MTSSKNIVTPGQMPSADSLMLEISEPVPVKFEKFIERDDCGFSSSIPEDISPGKEEKRLFLSAGIDIGNHWRKI